MAQTPISKLGVDANSIFFRNFIVGIWMGYFMNGFEESADNYWYKNKFSIFMVGVLTTLYLNEYFSMQSAAFLFYVTLKMGVIFEKDSWEYDNGKDSESQTRFGVFPAIGAEYLLVQSLAVFMAIGYNPYGWAEFGLRLNLGK